MSTQGSTANYVELSSQAYGLVVDGLAAATRARLDFWKSVWEIASRPYASTTIESTVRENFDRANQLTDLTVGELRARGQRSAEFSEKFLAQVTKFQDTALETLRDSLKAYVSTVDQVKETATALSANGSNLSETPSKLVPASN